MQRIKKLLYPWYVYFRFFLYAGKVEDMTTAETKRIMDHYYHQEPPQFQQKVKYHPVYDLMIIVPVYNAESYLEECAQSILEQKTKYSCQVVFVNDGSTDRSGSILERYQKMKNVKVIHQKNSGIGKARNRALQEICARYVMFVDADDILADGAVERLMNVALAEKADLVEGAHIEFSDNNPSVHLKKRAEWGKCTREKEEKKETVSGYPWGKVIAAEKMRNLSFPEGYLFEDTIIENLLLPECRVVVIIPDIVYYYRKNRNSVTASIEKQKVCMDTIYITYYCLKEAFDRGYKIDLEDFLRQVRLNWLRTQRMPIKIQKAIFMMEAEVLHRYFEEQKRPKKKSMQKLEEVLRKHWFDAYEWLMCNWKIWDENLK